MSILLIPVMGIYTISGADKVNSCLYFNIFEG